MKDRYEISFLSGLGVLETNRFLVSSATDIGPVFLWLQFTVLEKKTTWRQKIHISRFEAVVQRRTGGETPHAIKEASMNTFLPKHVQSI